MNNFFIQREQPERNDPFELFEVTVDGAVEFFQFTHRLNTLLLNTVVLFIGGTAEDLQKEQICPHLHIVGVLRKFRHILFNIRPLQITKIQHIKELFSKPTIRCRPGSEIIPVQIDIMLNHLGLLFISFKQEISILIDVMSLDKTDIFYQSEGEKLGVQGSGTVVVQKRPLDHLISLVDKDLSIG